MTANLLVLIVSLSITSSLAQQPHVKEGGARPKTTKRTLKDGKNLMRMPHRRDRNGRLLPSDREEMQFERWVRLAIRTYGLDDEQEEMVRREIEIIRQERREEMGAEADEYEQLRLQRDAMYEAAMTPEPGEQDMPASERVALQRERRRAARSDPAYVELQRRMRQIEEKHALDMDTYIRRIEQLLPEDQVRRAADKRRIMAERREQRREEHEQRVAEQRRKHEEQGRERQKKMPPITSVAQEAPRSEGSGSDSRVQAGSEPSPKAPKAEPGASPKGEPRRQPKAANADAQATQKEAELRRKAAEEEAARLAKAEAASRQKNMHPWEKHVRDFIAQYELTERQANAAMSILQDSLKREQQYLSAYSARIDAAKRITDKAKQDAELAKLEQPRLYIFKELTKRLDSLLTASQRAKGKAAAQQPKKKR